MDDPVIRQLQRGAGTAPFEIERAEEEPVFTKLVYLKIGYVLAFRPAFSVGVDNGHGTRRTCDPDRSRHYETALSSSESDDVVCQGRADRQIWGGAGPVRPARLWASS